jgi:hypothetical protein
MVVFSKKTWDTLSKEDQALLVKFGREAQLEERVLWEKYEKEAMDKARAAGITIIEIADKKPFRRGQAGVGQVRPEIRRHDQAYPGRTVVPLGPGAGPGPRGSYPEVRRGRHASAPVSREAGSGSAARTAEPAAC